jgi:hypothetical protein
VLVASLALSWGPWPAPAHGQARVPATGPWVRPESDPPAPAPAADWLKQLQVWLAAVREHSAGEPDAHVSTAAAFSRAQLIQLRTDLLALRERLMRHYRRPQGRDITHGGKTIGVDELQRVLGIDDAAATIGDIDALLRAAARLHTDVAVFSPATAALGATSADSSVLLLDGQHVGYQYEARHWEFARLMLDLVSTGPAIDPAVHRWYTAVAAVMRRQLAHGFSASHLERAGDLFPSDAILQFERGCLHEAMAAPGVQAFVRTADRRVVNVGNEEEELQKAQRFFRRAIDLDLGAAEARIRLGHVLIELGRPADAIAELTPALRLTDEPTLQYFGAMFLGDAQQALGRRAEAQAAYGRALMLFPSAQSVHLALGHLARRFGDRGAALAAMERLFDLPGDTGPRDDPWWRYSTGTVGSDMELLQNLFESLGTGDRW